MLIFDFWTAADLNNGLFLNSRIDQLYNNSLYGKDRVIFDIDSTTGVVYTGSSALPSPARSWKNNTPQNNTISTYNASEYTDLLVQGQAVDLTYLNSPNGAFVTHYVDGVNIENVSLYGTLGTTSTIRIPLNNKQVQDIRIQHTGYADKTGPTIFGPFNITGASMGPSIALKPNGTTTITDTWTFTGVNSSSFTLKRTSTGVVITYSYGTLIPNGIPGFDLVVNSGVVGGDSAYVQTNPMIVSLEQYKVYPNLASTSAWISPVMDSGDAQTAWETCSVEVQDQSQSMYELGTYVTNFQVGNTLPVDDTWTSIVPTETSYQNLPAVQQDQAYSRIMNSLESLRGRYGIVTISMSLYTDFIRNPKVYAWNPQLDRSYNLIGPVAKGPNLESLLAGIVGTYQDYLNKAILFSESLSVNKANHEFLFMWGQLLGFPIRRGESLTLYQARLTQLMQASYADSTLAFIQQAIRNYCNSTYPYIVQASAAPEQWILPPSLLGISTYLGAASSAYWTYEIHVQGAMPGISIDGLKEFIKLINPVGAIPILYLE